MPWKSNEYPGITFYGAEPTLTGPVPPPPEEDYQDDDCWARAIAALLGQSFAYVASFAPFHDILYGQENIDTAQTVKRINQDIEKKPKQEMPKRLRTESRWFGPGWTMQQVEAAYPRAVGLDDHWVVVLAIGFNATNQPTSVCFWDTDNRVKVEQFDGFKGSSNPELCYALEAR
jgi:hypothetical protein